METDLEVDDASTALAPSDASDSETIIETPDEASTLAPTEAPAESRTSRFAEMLIAMAERDVEQAIASGRPGDRAIARWTLEEVDRHLRELDVDPAVCAKVGTRARALAQRLSEGRAAGGRAAA